ncbi:pyruvate ferredoxin oxidoreductase [Candidatus Micrarchaeota archaeon]|nr:pyruvate ferredoxin oxidoreductase [Candidatus Micrarchaeota archaeon]
MAIQITSGSKAIAHTAANCGIDVVAAYPITPSTVIPEELSRIRLQHGFEFIAVESELSAMSAVIGASAAGARAFTATSSQGLLLMTEALYNASGLRLPVVMVVANRAIGGPLNIWNDWSDSISQRDCGWVQLYCKNKQEAVDTLVYAFRIAEETSTPIMVCFEGFYLTHEVSPVDVPSKEEALSFLPAFKPKHALDVSKPELFGAFAGPAVFQDYKQGQNSDFLGVFPAIEKASADFEKKFGRTQFALSEQLFMDDAEWVVLTMSSLAETTEVVVEKMRRQGVKVGLLRLKCFRPFPKKLVAKALAGKKGVVVLEKDAAQSSEGALAHDVKEALFEEKACLPVLSCVCGLGGKDVPTTAIESAVRKLIQGESGALWV